MELMSTHVRDVKGTFVTTFATLFQSVPALALGGWQLMQVRRGFSHRWG